MADSSPLQHRPIVTGWERTETAILEEELGDIVSELALRSEDPAPTGDRGDELVALRWAVATSRQLAMSCRRKGMDRPAVQAGRRADVLEHLLRRLAKETLDHV